MTADPGQTTSALAPFAVIVAARNEADRIGMTLDSLAAAFPAARIFVADDASQDETATVARSRGAEVVSAARARGKGGNVTAAAQALLARTSPPDGAIVLLCDGDLAESASLLAPLAEAARQSGGLAIASFAVRVGGGVGAALGFARRAIRQACGYEAGAPISGQRAMPVGLLREVLPFARGYGMETGMTIDAVRAGYPVTEIELDLAHRATGRTVAGFFHRFRQLRDIHAAYRARR